jgi:hypothetical protein
MIIHAKPLALFISIPLLLAAQSQSRSCGRASQNSSSTNATTTGKPQANVNSGTEVTVDNRNKNMSSSAKNNKGLVAEGVWGGPHIRLNVSAAGSEIEFDCAQGKINTALATDAEGRFDFQGTFFREGPGPVRLGREPSARPARYSGHVVDQTMTLNVKATDTNEDLGSFTLTRGSDGRLFKCR